MTEYQIQDPAANPLRVHLTQAHDLALARAFEALNAGTLAWSEERQIWRVLSDGTWLEDKSREAHEALREFVRLMDLAVAGMPDEARDAWAKAARQLKTLGARTTLLADARTGLAVSEATYDREPFLLNGPLDDVVDLTEGQPKPRPAEARFTKRTRIAYRPGAKSSLWDRFLEQVQPDAEMRAYIKRAFGAGLSGLGGERMLFVLWGPPGSGKSTATSVVSNALGSYAATLRHDSLALRTYGNSGHTSELMPLVGARAAFIHEIPEGMQLNAALLKTIVGGEEFSVSEKGKPHFTTRFVAKLYLVSNHPIALSATDDAAWARIRMLPFTHPIANPDLDAVRSLAEDPAVLEAALAWLVEGWLDFRKGGLRPPATAVEVAAGQRTRNSLIGEWLEARVVREAGAEMPSEAAYRSCLDFLASTGRGASLDTRRFSAELEAAGFAKAKTRAGRVWRGARLVGADGLAESPI
jgi:putative DNA primase/helicase